MKTSGSDTENLHKLLATWLDLNRVLHESNPKNPEVVPWDCETPAVQELWNQITDPANLRTLELWFYYLTADSELEAWTQEAIKECRRRSQEG